MIWVCISSIAASFFTPFSSSFFFLLFFSVIYYSLSEHVLLSISSKILIFWQLNKTSEIWLYLYFYIFFWFIYFLFFPNNLGILFRLFLVLVLFIHSCFCFSYFSRSFSGNFSRFFLIRFSYKETFSIKHCYHVYFIIQSKLSLYTFSATNNPPIAYSTVFNKISLGWTL